MSRERSNTNGCDRCRNRVDVLLPRAVRILSCTRIQHHTETIACYQLEQSNSTGTSIMGSFVAAWLVGAGIISYRSIKADHAPPLPGQLIISSGVFVLLGLLAEAEKARFLAQALAWGFDIAAFANLANLAPKTPANVNTVPWPPATAANTVIFPNGIISSQPGGSSTQSSQSTKSSGGAVST